jgi:hypothetical protein
MSVYTQYSNEGVTPWSALVDVVTHPVDSLKAFIGAPFALIGGAIATGGESISGIATPKLADLPAQQTIAQVVSANADTPTPPTAAAQAELIPTWLKVTAVAASLAAVVYMVRK